ncbi:hypothetical protein CYR40_10735 [Chimaeribacter arupi]|uniref:Uncharacterized protein n=2 Tax=Yersiniaceae TaxID=1903411 RepID=A0A2N5EQH1_9GAMM|nr:MULTISPECIES: hypothetical protein [Yersiniaceae]MBS0968356.1 hypothetical protein [Nissabacter archeti]MDV5139555.1 hypothetical protein [Chimaeribacter arupi]PLR38150.1 hypothetical protein CYR23_03955 [Chimaeribacter arupi]PLR46335.1 hypothetical protein CYR40_10735 [Chimaeribacter arupi]PLR51825.1 hypothetical protein CYR34_06095 [Chimaeribacter arupi]
MKKIGLTAAGLLALALTASSVSATAAPAEKAHDAPPSINEGRGPHDGFPGKMPPPLIPLYQASLQTDNPTEGLNKLLSVMPQKSGGHYEVRVSVVELPPMPPAPSAK